MQRLGIESEVLCLAESPSEEPIRIGGHTVHQVQQDLRLASARFSWSILKKFKDMVDRFDIIHYHAPWPPADLLYLLAGKHKPSVVTYHSDIVKQKFLKRIYAPLQSRFLSSVDCIVASSPNYRNTSKVLAEYRAKTAVVPFGMQERNKPDAELLSSWKMRVGQDFFLFIGELRYYKGIDFLINAARSTNLPVLIAGKGVIDMTELPDNVRTLGEISDEDKECLLTLCRAFIFPSHLRSEAFGMALLEAARAGRPMISCELGTGTSFVNLANETGLVVDPGSSHALAKAMRELWDNPDAVALYGKNGRKRYENIFTAERMCEKYDEIYRGVVDNVALPV